MVFKAKTFLNAVSKIAPLLYSSFERIRRAVGTPSLGDSVKEVYQEMYPVNLSKGLLERSSARAATGAMRVARPWHSLE